MSWVNKMNDKIRKHIVVELDKIGIETNEHNIKGYYSMNPDFNGIKEDIASWIELTGGAQAEIDYLNNSNAFFFKFSDKFDTWYIEFETYLIIDRVEDLEEYYKSLDKDLYIDFIPVDGNQIIFLPTQKEITL